MAKLMKNIIRNDSGFTLVEIVVALAVSMILVIGIYSSYRLLRRAQTTQDQVVEMQQNIRAALVWLGRDIRKAGYRKNRSSGSGTCNAGGSGTVVEPTIHTADATNLGFSMDMDSDGNCGGTGENVTYNLYVASDGITKLSRRNPGTNEAVAENFEAIEFFYTLVDNSQTLTPSATQLYKIRSVQISLLARTKNRSPGFDNSTITYPPASYVSPALLDSQWGPFTDGIRRQLIVTNVTFRNIGI